MIVTFEILPHYALNDTPPPSYATDGAAGIDLRAAIADSSGTYCLPPGGRMIVPTGLKVRIPPGYEGQLRPRSSLAINDGVTVLNAPGTIDCDYRGEIGVILINLGAHRKFIYHGDRIAQLVIAPVMQANLSFGPVVSDTKRGTGGFGSTGV